MSTELQKIESTFPVLGSGGQNLADLLAENLGGQTISAFDLPRARIPSGKSSSWDVEVGGEVEPSKSLRGIILSHRLTRSYWSRSLEESGGQPPDCFSDDSVHGYGEPGGECAACPYSKFGSAIPRAGDEAGRGQACSQRHQVFLLTEGEMLPTLISLPPTSLKPFRNFLLGLVSRGRKFSEVIVELGLEGKTSKSGNDHKIVKPAVVSEMTPEQVAKVAAYAKAISPGMAGAARGAASEPARGEAPA